MSNLTLDNIKTILHEVFKEIAPEINLKTIKTDQPLRDQVEIDSFDFYRIIVQIDKKTGVNIPDSKIHDLITLDNLIDYIIKNSTYN